MASYRAIQVKTLSTDFRQATEIIQVPKVSKAAPKHVLIENHYVGINATDINVTNGAYGNSKVPFRCGLEGVGVVRAIGEGVENVQVGQAVAYQHMGAFAEYVEVPAANIIPVPKVTPAVVPVTVCGISASIALEQVGELKPNETILVTAAAGGTGQFVVQLAKQLGCHVIGTCSSDEKVEYLKSIGCDRPINYTKEDLKQVLKAEYPDGVNVVFETIGGEMFRTAVENIAKHGRVIVFGYISSYKDNETKVPEISSADINRILLFRSASVRGFILHNHVQHIPTHIQRLLSLIQQGKLNPGLDLTEFNGLEAIPDALDRMYARKNIGKLVVRLNHETDLP